MSYPYGPTEDPDLRTPSWPNATVRSAAGWPETPAAVHRDAYADYAPDAPVYSPRALLSDRSTVYRWLMVGFFIVFLVYLVYLQTRSDVAMNGTLRGISDLFVLFGAAVCVFACWYTARTLRGMRAVAGVLIGRAWLAWLCLGGAALTYAIGQGIWTWYDANYTSASLPFPAVYDPFYLAVYPLSWVGIALLIPRGGTAAGRTRLLLDAGIAVASVLAISWYFILGPTIASLSGSPVEKVVALAYPLGDLSLCVAAALLLFGPSGAAALNASLARLGIGVTWLAFTDSLYGYLQLQGTYHTGLPQDIGWPMSWLFVGWAALVFPAGLARLATQRLPDEPSARRTRLNTTGAALRAITPILLALLTCAVLLLEDAVRSSVPLIQIVLVCAVLLLLPVVRQMLTLVDNLILNERLRTALGQSQQAYQLSQQELIATSSRAERYDELRAGIENLQAVHARLARGDLSVRAQIGGPLTPVAQSLNLLIDRLSRWVQFAQANQILETEAEQLRQILDELSEFRLSAFPSGRSPLPTGAALVAAGRLQRQLELRFGRQRAALEAIVRQWRATTDTVQHARASLQSGGLQDQRLQLAHDAVSQVESLLTSGEAVLQELWRESQGFVQRADTNDLARFYGSQPRIVDR